MNHNDGPPPAARPQLTMLQRRRVQEARALAATDGQSLSAGYSVTNPDNLGMVYGFAFGVAQGTVRELLDIIDDLTGATRGPLDPPQEVLDKMADRGLTELTDGER